jgi:hypothetical protein
MRSNIVRLSQIYQEFERHAAPYRASAACRKGCAYCCTDAGRIDITTLEGLAIREVMGGLPRARQLMLNKALAADLKKREKGQTSPCPFLMKNKACMIYAARPFACRRIYSVEICGKSQPPVLHRQVMDLGAGAIQALQRLDHAGYSGHLSFILCMLEAPGFLATYLAGEYAPQEIMNFGRSHNIVINRLAAP